MPPWPDIDPAHGISGLRFEDDDSATVVYIESAEPGQGNLSRYVDERIAMHPKSKTLRAQVVTNQIIQGMLLRRGFVKEGLTFTRYGVPDDEESSS